MDNLETIRRAALTIEWESRAAQGLYLNRDTAADHLREIQLAASGIIVQLSYVERALRVRNEANLKAQVKRALISSGAPDAAFRQEDDEEVTDAG